MADRARTEGSNSGHKKCQGCKQRPKPPNASRCPVCVERRAEQRRAAKRKATKNSESGQRWCSMCSKAQPVNKFRDVDAATCRSCCERSKMAHRTECTTATNTTRSSEQAMNEMLAAALNVVEVDGEVPTLDGGVPLGIPPASMQMLLGAAAETIPNVGPEQDTEADSSWIDGLIVVEDTPHGECVGADSEEVEALASRVGGLTLVRHEACMVGYFRQLTCGFMDALPYRTTQTPSCAREPQITCHMEGTPHAAALSAIETNLHTGQRVVIVGLTARADLNSSTGTIRSFQLKSGRFEVEIDGANSVLLRPSNLAECDGTTHPETVGWKDLTISAVKRASSKHKKRLGQAPLGSSESATQQRTGPTRLFVEPSDLEEWTGFSCGPKVQALNGVFPDVGWSFQQSIPNLDPNAIKSYSPAVQWIHSLAAIAQSLVTIGVIRTLYQTRDQEAGIVFDLLHQPLVRPGHIPGARREPTTWSLHIAEKEPLLLVRWMYIEADSFSDAQHRAFSVTCRAGKSETVKVSRVSAESLDEVHEARRYLLANELQLSPCYR